MASKVVIHLENDKTVELPLIYGSFGENAIDVSSLYKQTGMFTYDPGFLSTASCQSSITYIDGDKGVLLHRGYNISDLAENASFTSLFYALLFNDLPLEEEKRAFEKKLLENLSVQKKIKAIIYSFDRGAHPMAIMMAVLSMLSSLKGYLYNPYEVASIEETSIEVLAQVCAAGAFVFRYTNNLPELEENIDFKKGFEWNIVKLMFEGTEGEKHLDIVERAINKIFVLHADHEQNASTSSVRLVASTDVNLYASLTAGFAALWGPLHGGANEAVIKMLSEIGKSENIPLYIRKAKDKEDPFRLMGFGHRVYKNYDPRAAVLKSSCDAILASLSVAENEELKIAKDLERIALSDEYFIDRKLFPNVDFYSGIIYKALGVQSNFFTVIFGMARTAGWCAQVKEAMQDKAKKISRPRQVYIGNTSKKVKIKA